MLAIKLTTFTGGGLKNDAIHTRHCLRVGTGTVHNVVAFPKGFKISTYSSGRKRAAIVVNINTVIIAITQVPNEDVFPTQMRYEGLKLHGTSL
jgi:hypothetical protein